MGATYKLKRKLADGTLEDVVLQGVGGGGSSDIPLATTEANGLMSATDKQKVDWLDLDTSDGYIFTIGDDSVTSARIELNNNDNSVNATGEEVHIRTIFGNVYVTSKDEIVLQAEGDITANGNNVCTANMAVPFIPSDAFTVVAGSTYNPTKWSVENVSGITTPTDGMTIAVRTPKAGHSYGILLSIDGGSNYYPIVRNRNQTVAAEYPQSSTLILTFNASQTSGVYSGSSTPTTVTGCWQIADYNSDVNVYQVSTIADSNFPVLFQYRAGATSTSNTTDYIRFSNNMYVNPSTGTIYANDFVVDGKSIVADVATTDNAGIVKPDGETITVDDDGTIHAVGGSGGVAQLQQSVTYAELKALRDNGELVAGMQYRITDFVTTTSQPDTQSAGHPFDIIVTALSNTTLSENASADLSATKSIANADGSLAQGSVQPYYYVFEDFNNATGPTEGYKAGDIFVAYDYLENNDGVVVPVLYKNEVEAYGEEGPDYQDKFYYEGTMELDGVTYDKWRKICEDGDGPYWDASTGSIWVLTNIIVQDGQIGGGATDTYFANANLPAWEIKYCLDNDKTRFAWAVVGDYWISTDFGEKDYILNEKITIDGQEFFKTTHDSVFSLVSQPKTTKELYVYNSTSGELVTFEEDGSAIYDWGEENAGKGVIYYIKDEWDNECPYDFKNIQFKRSTDWFAKHGDWGENVLGYTPTEDKWFYTFTWVDENDEPQDLTLIGNSLLNDEGKINGVFGNKIGICSEYQIYFGENSVEALSYNVFVSSYYCEDGLFYGCYSNTFGNDCYSNTFSNDCNYNTFGNKCSSNTFGNECYSNTFGNECYSNTFSNDCNYNTFGNGCSKNTLSEYAFCNIFENGVVFVDLTSTTQGNDENRLQYITVSQGVTGAASTRKTINATRNLAYKTTYVAQGSVTTEV